MENNTSQNKLNSSSLDQIFSDNTSNISFSIDEIKKITGINSFYDDEDNLNFIKALNQNDIDNRKRAIGHSYINNTLFKFMSDNSDFPNNRNKSVIKNKSYQLSKFKNYKSRFKNK